MLTSFFQLLAAVDIGRFLSGVLLRAYAKFEVCLQGDNRPEKERAHSRRRDLDVLAGLAFRVAVLRSSRMWRRARFVFSSQ